MAKPRKPKQITGWKAEIVYKKLHGEYGCIEWFDGGKVRISIDPHQPPQEMMDTIIHESLHFFAPNWSEESVTKAAKNITQFLWNARFRRMESDQ